MTWLSDSALDRLTTVVAAGGAEPERYELLEEIGRGGMGVVFRGHDRQLDRDVAIKIHHSPIIDTDRVGEEARILAQLEHPGIVPIHDVGWLADGRMFYVMKLVRGERLDRAIGSMALAERLRIFERLCEPVAFAHAHGIVHRDLKPQNVMIGAFGEVLILDWGVAAVRGTPGYMAPEQMFDGLGAIDPRTDVYALGGILSVMIPGSPAVREEAEPRAVAAIARRARQVRPGDRYPTADALVADVRRFTSLLAVQVYRESPMEQIWRLAVKYRTALLLVTAYLAMRVGMLLVF